MPALRTFLGFAAGLAGGAGLVLSAGSAAREPAPRPQGQAAGHSAPRPRVAEPPGPEIGYRGCAYFENAGFAGRRGDVRAGATAEWVGAVWNERISSVACASGCRLIGYEHINYGGARRNFTGAVADAGAWSDRISALRVVCAADAAPHHEEPH